MVTPTKILDAAGNTAVITAGNDFAVTVTLTQNGGSTYDLSVGGTAVVTCSIRAEGANVDAIADHVVTVTTAASGIVTLTLTDTETADLQVPSKKATDSTKLHLGDFKVVENGGNILHCGPFSFPVRRAIT